jgi:hypothetical protein
MMEIPIFVPTKCTIAAIFARSSDAHQAAARLKDADFTNLWIGLAKQQQPEPDTSSPSFAENARIEAENWFERIFGENDETLHDALVQRGVASADISRIGPMGSFEAVLTVDGRSQPDDAARILVECGGRLVNGGFLDTEMEARQRIVEWEREQPPSLRMPLPATMNGQLANP